MDSSSPFVEQIDDVITGGIPRNPRDVPLCDVTIGDCASSSVSSNFLLGWTIQAWRGSAGSKLCVFWAGNFDGRPTRSFWNADLMSVRRASETLAAAAHFDSGDSEVTG